jgi:hypothetical protein
MDIISVLVLPCRDADDLAAVVILSMGQQSDGGYTKNITLA